MRINCHLFITILVALGAVNVQAMDRYVAQNGQTPASPYTDWTSAASNIQDAVTAAATGDVVWVGDGIYRAPTNGVVYSGVTNVVYINKPLTLRSSSGVRSAVVIDGLGTNRGINIAYAINTTNRFVVSGLTVSNAYQKGILFYAGALNISWTGVVENCVVVDGKGGGGIGDDVTTYNTSARTIIISNCVVRGNAGVGIAISFAGGGTLTSLIADSTIEYNLGSGLSLLSGTQTMSRCIIRGNMSPSTSGGLSLGAGTFMMDNCLVCGNTAAGYGGAIYKYNAAGPLYINNCTIVSNLSTVNGPGGIRSAAANPVVNSIICANYYNAAEVNIYVTGGNTTLTNCLSPGYSGSGNIATPLPAFENAAGGDYRLKRWSAGVDAGLVQAGMDAATDLGGQSRLSANGRVDMGAYETSYQAHPGYYVAQNGQTPVSPYTNLTMAASNIQEAVNMVVDTIYPTPLVLIGPGRYTLPPNAVNYGGSNVVYISVNTILRGTSGNPADTVIDGEGTNRGVAIIYNTLGKEIVLDGLTISNCHGVTMGGGILVADSVFYGYGAAGWTGRVQNCRILNNTVSYGTGIAFQAEGAYGGGVGMYARSASALVLSNCLVRGNFATNEMALETSGGIGGGIYYGGYGGLTSVMDSLLQSNRAYRGGNGYLGGGPIRFEWCEISAGRCGYGSQSFGGGLFVLSDALFRNCVFYDNNCWSGGRGSAINDEGRGSNTALLVENCTFAGNLNTGYAIYIRAWAAAQTYMPSLHMVNSVVYSNYGDILLGVTTEGPHANYSSYVSNCCVGSTNVGVMYGPTNLLYFLGLSSGTFTNNPRYANYAAGNYRLNPDSPCLNRGVNLGWMEGALDFDGNPRISPLTAGTVDMGAYEFLIQSGSIFSVR